jgi:hypothetical protein
VRVDGCEGGPPTIDVVNKPVGVEEMGDHSIFVSGRSGCS